MKDGPYIYKASDNAYLKITVDSHGRIDRDYVNSIGDPIRCEIDNGDDESFEFKLRKENNRLNIAPATMTSKLIVISDIEGNFNALQGILMANGVVNKAYDWVFGDGQLLLCGDMVDRGNNVIPVLWLIYKLESQAQKAGGHVYFLLGNHEDLFLSSKLRYVHPKYITNAKSITKIESSIDAFNELNSESLILRQWMSQKDSLQKIGEILFVHGGISIDLIEKGLDVKEINSLIKKGLTKDPLKPTSRMPLVSFLFSNKGPLWYRGMVMDYKDQYKKMEEADVDKVLKYFNVKHIVIGHSIISEVSSDFSHKLFRIDVGHPEERSTGKAQGLLIESSNFYRINDLGDRELL